jgi:oligopeptide transport system substrate-binding protein
VTITFDAKGGSAVAPVTVAKNGSLAAPTAPTRAGYTFGGWFRGRPGLTWLEPEAVEFPLTADASTTFFAYWEPVNSKLVNYSEGETYFTSLSQSSGARFNPMTYLWSHEDAIMGDMSTPLYSTEVDWDAAIEKGIADFPGDFSKIEADEFSIDALDFGYILVGAKSYPKDVEGNDFTVDGKYDRLVAAQTGRTEWIFEMREDIFFENGTQVDASVVEYTLKQFLDPLQANRRATSYYQRPGTRDSGLPILNAEAYRFQTAEAPVAWDTVGFDIIDQFTFKITGWKAISQAQAVGFGSIRLVEPTIFAASLTNGVNSTYGTPANPFVSYGAYLIKSWSDNQRIVMNKNFEYVRRDLITYKSIVYEFTTGPEQNVQLFKAGDLSAAGLLGADFIEFAENPGVKFSWSGYPQYMIVNFAPSTKTEGAYVKSAITADERFRQALFFAFDRDTYNSTIYTPNVSAVLPVPYNIKAYLEDTLFYSQSPQHLENLADFGIPDGTNGYLPDRARQLFEAALADFKAANPTFTGPINLKLAVLDSPLNLQLATFVKNQLESTFNTVVNGVNQLDKVVVNIVAAAQDAHDVTIGTWDFDLNLVNLGFGSSTGVQWQYGSIAFIASLLFGPSFGLHTPTDFDGSNMLADPESIFNQPVNIDLSSTLAYLEDQGEDWIYEVDADDEYVRPGHVEIYEALLADAESGKPAGIYAEPLIDLLVYMYVSDTPYDATRSAPFAGATQDVWSIVAAMEAAFFELMPLIPTSSLQSAVIYADNVEILWPAYSDTFGWGSTRYRFLSSDPDFADGLYNSFEVAFLAQAA